MNIFVYGTLRHGEGNWSWALRDRTEGMQNGTVAGFQLYGVQGFPYAVKTPDSPESHVHGEMFTIGNDLAGQVLADLDSLEGYNPNPDPDSPYARFGNHYERELVTVNLTDGSTAQAHMYYVNDLPRELPRTPGDDWARRREHVSTPSLEQEYVALYARLFAMENN